MAGRASKRAVERCIVRVGLGRMTISWKITLRMIDKDASLEEVVVKIRYWPAVEVEGSSSALSRCSDGTAFRLALYR